MRKYALCCTLLAICLLGRPNRSGAEQIRFRYVPGPTDVTTQVAAGPEGAMGEHLTGIGLIPKPFKETFRPTHMVTFRHPFTSQNVTVPLTLPDGSRRVVTRSDRLTYNFGSFWIDVRFLPDGSVETIYNSGFLRAYPR